MAVTKRKEPPSVERKIYFFRSSTGTDTSGQNIPFLPLRSLTALNKLAFKDNGGRYLVDPDGNALCAWVDTLGKSPRMRFAQIRRVGLPQIDAAGSLTDLNLQTTEGLVEAAHIVFFPDGIVGAEFNFYAPRPSRLGYYLARVASLSEMPTFAPLLRYDATAQLDRLQDIRLFDLKIQASYASILKQADTDLGAAFEAACAIGAPEEVQIVLQARKANANGLLKRLKTTTKKLLLRPTLRTEASHFIIRGQTTDTGRVEPLDLLRDQLISRKRIVRLNDRGRALDRNAAYDAVVEAYNELSAELADAAAVLQ